MTDSKNSTKPCKFCQNPVAPNADLCPKCGGKKPYPYNAAPTGSGCLPSAIKCTILIVVGVWGITASRSCITELDRQSRLEERRLAQIEAAKTPEQRQREAELEEYRRLQGETLVRPGLIENAEWWLGRKRLRLQQALAPGSGQDRRLARRDFDEAQEKLNALLEEERRYQELVKKYRRSTKVAKTDTIEAAIEGLGSDSPSVRLNALDTLAGFPKRVPSNAFDALKTLTTDDDPDIRWRAIFVLGEMPDRATDRVPLFVTALTDESADVRRWAWSGLNTIAANSAPALAYAATDLVTILIDPSTPTPSRGRILCVLGDMGPSADDTILAIREIVENPHEQEQIRTAARWVLEHLESPLTPLAWGERKLQILLITRESD